MSASGNIINYNIRTCKSIERRMVLSTVRELFKSVPYSERRYIGFGSTYFTDYKLFHKELHIDNMLSFELEAKLLKRVEFNKPFKCIDIQIGKSTDLLPNIDWDNNIKDLIWMDYDDTLNYDMFNDIEHIFSNIKTGSIYLMTCNKQLNGYKSVDEFNDDFDTLVPNDIHINEFAGDKDFLLIRKMLLSKIEEVIKGRNHTLIDEQHLIFHQLFFFTYRDGAPMLSFGGFLSLKNSVFNLDTYNLNNFDFIKQNDERYIIDPPILSLKETYLLNSHLPNNEDDFNNQDELDFIPITDKNKFRKLYKFLPSYMDVIH